MPAVSLFFHSLLRACLLAMAAAWVMAPRLAAQRSDTVVRTIRAEQRPGVGRLVPEIAFGGSTGAPEYTFSTIYAFGMGPDGSVYVVDRGSGSLTAGIGAAVRQYDTSGKYVRTFGRSGQGPGEYGAPVCVGVLPDERVVVCDPANGRLNIYAKDGRSVATWGVPGGASGNFTNGSRLFIDSSGIASYRVGNFGTVGPSAQPGDAPFIRFRPDGRVIDTVFIPQLPRPPVAPLEAGGRGTAVPFMPTAVWAWSPLGYFVTAITDRYAIDLRLAPSGGRAWRPGDPVVSLRRPTEPVAVTDAEAADWKKATEAFLRVSSPSWQWTGPDIPKVKPALRRLRVGDDGRIWVLPSLPAVQRPPVSPPNTGTIEPNVGWYEPFIYDVFEPDGRYLGQVETPPDVSFLMTHNDTAWGVVRNSDGIYIVRRYRIVWA